MTNDTQAQAQKKSRRSRRRNKAKGNPALNWSPDQYDAPLQPPSHVVTVTDDEGDAVHYILSDAQARSLKNRLVIEAAKTTGNGKIIFDHQEGFAFFMLEEILSITSKIRIEKVA